MNEIEQSIPVEATPNSTELWARAQRESEAMCEAIAAKAREDLARLKLAQAEELAREEARARRSVARTWWTTAAAIVVVGVVAAFAMPRLAAPRLLEQNDDSSIVQAMQPRPVLAFSTARAEPEVGKTRRADYREQEPTRTPQGPCNEWDPLAFCMR